MRMVDGKMVFDSLEEQYEYEARSPGDAPICGECQNKLITDGQGNLKHPPDTGCRSLR